MSAFLTTFCAWVTSSSTKGISMSFVDNEYWTPQQYAAALRVDIKKVLGWIRSGELNATNTNDTGRPKYKIAPWAREEFERNRSPYAKQSVAEITQVAPAAKEYV